MIWQVRFNSLAEVWLVVGPIRSVNPMQTGGEQIMPLTLPPASPPQIQKDIYASV